MSSSGRLGLRPDHSAGRRFACEPLEARTLLSAGDLDPSLRFGGVTEVTFADNEQLRVHDVAVQADGRIILAGTKGLDAAVVRLTAYGALDSSFAGGRGVFEFDRALLNQPNGVAIQADGRIVVAGVKSSGINTWAVVARLTADGAPDGTFGTDGVVRTGVGAVGYESAAQAEDVALEGDGRIVVDGSAIASAATPDADIDFLVARYNPDGSLDPTFGQGGIRLVGFGDDEFARALAIDYNGTPVTNPYWGTIAVAGRQGIDRGTKSFAVARLTADGGLDNSFSGDGRVVTASTGADTDATGVVIQLGGKVVATGTLGPGDNQVLGHNFLLVRYLPNGNLDPTFGANGTGRVETDFGGSDFAETAAAGYLGGILVGGTSDSHFAVAAYTRDGLLDTRFSGDGLQRSSQLVGQAARTALALSPGRRFVIAGGRSVARYFDVVSVVSVGSFDPTAHEGGDAASLLVARTERLPFAERVYFNVSGTALRPNNFRHRPPDYNAAGMTFGAEFSTEPTFVDIPANETFTTVTITPTNDTASEGDETAVFSIAPYAFYDVGTNPSATVVIVDDEAPPAPQVVGRHVYYDEGAADIAAGDDAAIAPDKRALLPGEAVSFANVTSYTRGINGVMVDILNPPDNGAEVTRASFAFRAGAGGDPAAWAAVDSPVGFIVRPNAGVNGSDRVVFAWPANTIRNKWLRVTVLADAATGLAAPDVFYFGNLAGETGDAAGSTFRVTALDLAAVKRAFSTTAAMDSPLDLNRDGRINALDLAAVRQSLNQSLPPPVTAAAAPPDSPLAPVLRGEGRGEGLF